MSKFIDLTGQRFGMWLVVSRAGYQGNAITWNCLCDCGNTKVVRGDNLRSGRTRSCGCLLIKHEKKRTYMTRTRLQSIYHGMKLRCYNKSQANFKYYGGRGIKICDEWKNNSKAFYEWALTNGYQDHLTLDRIDNDGNYEPLNCRWVTQREQNANRRLKSNTGVVGVCYHKRNKRYAASIRISGKLHHLGYTKNLHEAIALRRQAESALLGNLST